MTPPESAGSVLRRGITLSSAFTKGLGWTLLLAVISTAGRLILPVTIQLVVDKTARATHPDTRVISALIAAAAVGILFSSAIGYLMELRLITNAELGLAETRVRVFRHIHELTMLRLQAESRGALVSRVTGDVDTLMSFVQHNGLTLLMSLLQVFLTTVVMACYSWQLTLVVWLCFLTVFLTLRRAQSRMASLFGTVRERVAALMTQVSEALASLPVLPTPRVRKRVVARTVRSVDSLVASKIRAQRLTTMALAVSEVIAALVVLAIVVVGAALIDAENLTIGELTAILFLATLLITPAQMGVEMLTETQNALATWRRVLAVIDIEGRLPQATVGAGTRSSGPVEVRFEDVAFVYPDSSAALQQIDVEITAGSRVAVVGQTGSGKTTFGYLAVRLIDPTAGRVLLDGVDMAHQPHEALQGRAVMVPQDVFLFDASVADNVRYGAPELTDVEIEDLFAALGLSDWLGDLPRGVATQVGPRGEALSAGERQFVAIARAHAAAPDLLVLDEATSAVDPQTELRIQEAFNRLTQDRTSIVIAHRLSTATAADNVLVFDQGRLVGAGTHSELLHHNAIYASLYRAWSHRVGNIPTKSTITGGTE
ncbi:ABC transporter ATP-binding protein [Streptomyces sp. NPDC004752]